MKTFLKILAIALLGSFSPGAFNARADLEVGAVVQINAKADFYAPLTPQGSWVEVRSYGRCWRPASVAVEWRPYSHGYWVWTDCGWYWYSDEPWAWACYHYGYWVYDAGYGWVWAPDVVWGPAWVSWRVGGGYIGWAPMPPPGFSVRVAAPSLFVFVEAVRFTDPVRPAKVIVNNTTIIKQTTVINNVKQVNRTFDGSASQKVVVNEGPGVAAIEKATSKKISVVPIREAAQRTPPPATVERKLAPERKLTPTDRPATVEKTPAPPARPSTPPGLDGRPPGNEIVPPPTTPELPKREQGNRPPPNEIGPPPGLPPGRGALPGNPGGRPEGRGKGPEIDKGKGQDKDKP